MVLNTSQWNPDEIEIFKKFRYKCVRCRRPASVLHEIVPKSLAPENWDEPGNQVPLCIECHNWAHKRGAASSAEELKEWMEVRLALYR